MPRPGVTPLAMTTNYSWNNLPNTRTQLRRLQRKHTQHSYKLLKDKLIQLVRPMPPSAMQMTDLENFRATLFASAGKQPHDAEEDMVSLRAALQPMEAQEQLNSHWHARQT